MNLIAMERNTVAVQVLCSSLNLRLVLSLMQKSGTSHVVQLYRSKQAMLTRFSSDTSHYVSEHLRTSWLDLHNVFMFCMLLPQFKWSLHIPTNLGVCSICTVCIMVCEFLMSPLA